MSFVSPVCLLIFLPLLMLVVYVCRGKQRNLILLIGSLIAYAWAEPYYILLLLLLIGLNYLIGSLLRQWDGVRRTVLFMGGVAVNLAALLVFRYLEFLLISAREFLSIFWWGLGDAVTVVRWTVPIGLVMIVLRGISMLTDLFRSGRSDKPLSFVNTGLYISFFPLLFSAPLMRYDAFDSQLAERRLGASDFGGGLARFAMGLCKKIWIADMLGAFVNRIFDLGEQQLTTGFAWLGLLLFVLQFYFDFSAYADMAIGIGKMVGISLPELFDAPFLATSLQDFWHRWNVPLADWFYTYLYAPICVSNEKRTVYLTKKRFFFTTLMIFSFVGLLYGAGWNFLVLGLIHFVFFLLEKWEPLHRILTKFHGILGRVWTLLIVTLSLVLLRCDSFASAGFYWKALFGFDAVSISSFGLLEWFTPETYLALFAALLFATPLLTGLVRKKMGHLPAVRIVGYGALGILTALAFVWICGGAALPFLCESLL